MLLILTNMVRPFLTLLFACLLVYLALNNKISTDFIQGLAAGLINFWFAERAALADPKQPNP
jgi:hypothetical protein